jgi:hypothetical protein
LLQYQHGSFHVAMSASGPYVAFTASETPKHLLVSQHRSGGYIAFTASQLL